MEKAVTHCIKKGEKWFHSKDWSVQMFQKEAWQAYLEGEQGIVNAPTGTGKTLSLAFPILCKIDSETSSEDKLYAIWVCPIKALMVEIHKAFELAVQENKFNITVGLWNGDTPTKQRQKLFSHPPNILITTPESLHVLFCKNGYSDYFSNLHSVVVDEWHELVGSKRGVQMELALSKFRHLNPELKTWAISATIKNIEQSLLLLLGVNSQSTSQKIIKADIKKIISVESIIPEKMEKYPWSGHIGIRLSDRVKEIVDRHKSTLVFTNTRGQCEIWYHEMISKYPGLIGVVAMHHGSLEKETRSWVENALHDGTLKAVFCTSSLDLGVDFRPVDAVVQVGSPKGVARFAQRAGRSGHSPNAPSKIYFLPTNALELAEAAALREAVAKDEYEEKLIYIRSFDVLCQYIVTLSVSEGFDAEKLYREITTCYSYSSVTKQEWDWCLNFLSDGGPSLNAYDDYGKIGHYNGTYFIKNKRVKTRHLLSIGTIVSETALKVQYMNGRRLGVVEEYFISRMNPGDVFWFSGRALEFVKISGMSAIVKPSKKKTGKIPSWLGGRIQLSSMMSAKLRRKIQEAGFGEFHDIELQALSPLLDKQKELSRIPQEDEFLVECFTSKDGFHVLMYPFEGRFVNEGLANLVARKLADTYHMTFSIAMNDYGFELLTSDSFYLDDAIIADLLSFDNLSQAILQSVNSVEMAQKKFRDIANISGLLFQGFPGAKKKDKHIQSSASLLFKVFHEYDPDNLLYLQAHEEAMTFQLEEARLRKALDRLAKARIILTFPERYTPFSFPIVVDRLRERVSGTTLEKLIPQMILDS